MIAVSSMEHRQEPERSDHFLSKDSALPVEIENVFAYVGLVAGWIGVVLLFISATAAFVSGFVALYSCTRGLMHSEKKMIAMWGFMPSLVVIFISVGPTFGPLLWVQ